MLRLTRTSEGVYDNRDNTVLVNEAQIAWLQGMGTGATHIVFSSGVWVDVTESIEDLQAHLIVRTAPR